MLSYQSYAPGFDLRVGSQCETQYAGTGKEMHEAIFFLLQNLALQLGLVDLVTVSKIVLSRDTHRGTSWKSFYK